MRYILNNEGYIYDVSFGAEIECSLGTCTEYKGKVPDGYETIEDWFDGEIERLNAWKIVDGNLVFDENRDYKLKILFDQQNNENSCVTRKEMGMASTEEINPYTDLFPSQQSAGGYITSLSEEFNKVGNLPTEEVNLSLLEEQDLDLIELEFIGNNFLPNTATSSVNNGIEYTQNKDKTIKISGTATDRSTLNLAGTDTSVRNILTFKANENYLLFGLTDGVSLEFYKYDGSDRTLVGIYNGGVISFEEDTNVTQVVLVVDKGITIDTTIKPMLQLVGLEYPVLPMKKYNETNLYNFKDTYQVTSGITVDDEGWITVTYDNTEGTSTRYFNYYINSSDLVKTSKKYCLVTEIKNVSGDGSIAPSSYASICQLTNEYYYNFSDLTNGDIKVGISPTFDDFTDTVMLLRTFIAFNVGQSGSITFRLSLLEDISITSDIFEYKKHLGRNGQYYVDGISIQAVRSGKNLLGLIDGTYTNSGITAIVQNGVVIVNGTYTGSSASWLNISSKQYSLISGNTYTLSLNNLEALTGGVQLRTLSSGALDCSFATSNRANIQTLTSDGSNSRVQIRLVQGITFNNFVFKPQIEIGSTATEFEEFGVSPSPDYHSEIINKYKAGAYNAIADNKIFKFTLSEDLRGLPNGVGDRLWIDVDGDNGIDIEKRVGSVVLNGSEGYSTRTSATSGVYGVECNIVLDTISPINADTLPNILCDYFVQETENQRYTNNIGVSLSSSNKLRFYDGVSASASEFKTWLSTHNTEVYYELAVYTTSYIPQFTSEEFEYEEYKNNTTLIDLAGNEFTVADDINIKNNQIILIKNNKEIYLGNTVMPRTYTPYTHAYCHQRVYIGFKYKDPRNVDITKINLKGLISITDIETEYNFTSDDLTKIQNYIMDTGTLTDEEIELYDVNGDGVISASDYVLIKNMINGVISNKIIGTLEINSTQSKRTIVLRDSEGKIKTSLGLNGATTPSLSTEQLILDGVKQPKIMSGTSLPEEVIDGAVFLLYDE